MSIADRLSALCSTPLTVHLHENKSTYLRTWRSFGRLHIHLHRLFLEAPTPVLEAVLRFASKKDKNALRVIRQMANLYFAQNKIEPAKLKEQGTAYDLRAIYERIKAQYFEPNYDALIGWSDRKPTGKCRFLTFGSYDRQAHQIRINRLLDDPQVPLFFIEFIVYHEMLHAICPPIIDDRGRTWVHTKEFKTKEKQFAHFAAAREWEKQSLIFFKKRMKHGRS